MVRSNRPQLFYKIGILKKFGNKTRTQQCWSYFLRKSSKIKRLHYRFFPDNFPENTYFTEHLRWSRVCLKKLYVVGSHEKVFEWLVANEFFIMKKDPFNQIIKKWPPKGVFVDLLGKYLGMNVGL